MTTSNGYTLQYSKNFRTAMFHFSIKETGAYVGVPENEHVNINVTAHGCLEVTYYSHTQRDDISVLPQENLKKLFTSNKNVHGIYYLSREGLHLDDPTKVLQCTIINESLITANQDNGEIDIDPLFVDDRQEDTTERH